MMGFGFLGMFLLWAIPLALVIGGAGLAFRQTGGAGTPGVQRQPKARQILDERFAQGEISQEEYEAIRARLEN